ncbi:MAG: ATP-dependent 6-phosphofructokinase [Erysipelotrichia bacterium]|nr:ATP-dependent 6-phosphofructokinase [Erysipelotrichia bacterium]
MDISQNDFLIQTLGKPEFDSPLKLSKIDGDYLTNYVNEYEKILYDNSLCRIKEEIAAGREPLAFEKAGPREKIFFDPAKTRAAIVTCGGLCPGINDVIRGIVMQLSFWYQVKSIYGFRYGYLGMIKESGLQPMILDPDIVSEIHEKGGTILGSSRGHQDVGKMVDRLMDFNINILFCIGGDGTLKGAKEITDEINKRGLPIAVVGIPKTIDNDIGYIEKTFGFETAFTHAVDSIRTAHVEAKGYQNCVGLVKLMGRQSGLITANASIASQDVNFCLVPEIPFDLEGPNGFYEHLLDRIKRKNHAVVVVAEGVGDQLCALDEKDASGNRKFGDIGVYLRDGISKYFKKTGVPVTVKYIDPSYIIRSSCAIPSDSIYCNQLAQNAVHAGMTGKTGMVVGIWNNSFTYVPIDIAIRNRKFIDPESMFWLNVLETTGQPRWMQNKPRIES